MNSSSRAEGLQPWRSLVHRCQEEMHAFRTPDGRPPHEASGPQLLAIQNLPAREFVFPVGAAGLAVKAVLDPSPAKGRTSRFEVEVQKGKKTQRKVFPFAMSIMGDARQAAQQLQRQILGLEVVDPPRPPTLDYIISRICVEAGALKERSLRAVYGANADLSRLTGVEMTDVFEKLDTYDFVIKLREDDPGHNLVDIKVQLRLDLRGSTLSLVFSGTTTEIGNVRTHPFNYLLDSMTKVVPALLADLTRIGAANTPKPNGHETSNGERRKAVNKSVRPSRAHSLS